jgi:hypothetical protein
VVAAAVALALGVLVAALVALAFAVLVALAVAVTVASASAVAAVVSSAVSATSVVSAPQPTRLAPKTHITAMIASTTIFLIVFFIFSPFPFFADFAY